MTFFVPQIFLKKKFKVIASGINVMARSRPLPENQVVSIIVPVYNEVRTFSELIKLVITKEIPLLQKEIIIVESNSTDGTREEVSKYKDMNGVKVIFEEKPQGKGHAVRTGIKHAKGDFILIQDGDLDYDLNDYEQLLEPLMKYQKAFVLGSRHLKGWKMRQFTGQPFMSLFMNFGQIFFTTLLNLFCGQNMKDPFTMYKLFRRDCLYGMSLVSNRFDLDWEIVIKLVRKGYIPLEIPVNYKSRSFKEGKKVSIIKDPITWLWALVRFRFCNLFDKDGKSEK
jgi:glycosyltransferase involved in cell wall biosynthesis